MSNPSTRRSTWSWIFYDWANSAFSTVVMAGFFPVFFKQYWAAGLTATDSTFWLGAANAAASLMVVVLAPLIGAIADRMQRRKGWLLLFAVTGMVMTGGLFLAQQGHWVMALCLYVFAVLGFSGGNLFYDSLLVEVAGPGRYDRISGMGFAMGYLGGGLLFAFDVLMTLNPEWFGLRDAGEAVRWSFLSVALWWALFSLPLWLFVHEKQTDGAHGFAEAVRGGLAQLRHTFQAIRQLRVTFLFLLAYWLYIDGVDTIVRMAVDYGLSLGFPADSLMVALLITQFVGFPAAILFGRLGEKRGPKFGIGIGILAYVLVVLWAYRMREAWEFYALAVTIGLVQGGIQALSRSLYARLVPPGCSAEFFGFYNMLGKFAAVIGPVLMGWVAVLSGSNRLSILSVLLLFVAGGWLLARVDVAQGERAAREFHG